MQAFQERHLDKAARLIAGSFLELNPIWRSSGSDFEQLVNSVRKKILPCCGVSHSFVLVLKGQVISSSIQMDFVDYMNLPSIPPAGPLMPTLAKYAKLLDAKIGPREGGMPRRGRVAYGLYGVIDPRFASKGYALRFWVTQFTLGKALGWQAFYSRLSNEASWRIMAAIGT